MSKENRKRVYDQLVAANRPDKISEALQKEFGEVKIAVLDKPVKGKKGLFGKVKK